MLEFLNLLLIASLATGAGYLGGRWYAVYKQAHLQAKLDTDTDTDTDNFMAMLEERNQDYVKQKQQIDLARSQSGTVQVERDQALGRLELEQEKTAQLRQVIDELNEKQQRMRLRYSELEESRSQFRDAKLTLETERSQLSQRVQQLTNRNDQLEQKFNTALVDKTRLQTDMVAKERERQELRQRLTRQEDLNQSTELTLAQMRTAREEITQQLAHANGQLRMIDTLKQTLRAPQQQADKQRAEQQLQQDFVALTDKLSG